jgi:hypothetical protein
VGRVVHLRVDGVARDAVDQLPALSLLHLASLVGRDLYLPPLDDLGDDGHRVRRAEHLLEVALGRSVTARRVLEDVAGGDDVLEVALELTALDRECRVRVHEHLEPRAV